METTRNLLARNVVLATSALLLLTTGLAALPAVSAHVEFCTGTEYVSAPTGNLHSHQENCEDPEDPDTSWARVPNLPLAPLVGP